MSHNKSNHSIQGGRLVQLLEGNAISGGRVVMRMGLMAGKARDLRQPSKQNGSFRFSDAMTKPRLQQHITYNYKSSMFIVIYNMLFGLTPFLNNRNLLLTRARSMCPNSSAMPARHHPRSIYRAPKHPPASHPQVYKPILLYNDFFSIHFSIQLPFEFLFFVVSTIIFKASGAESQGIFTSTNCNPFPFWNSLS